MANNDRNQEQDDGRVIADMSAIERPRMLLPGRRKRSSETEDDAGKSNHQAAPSEEMSKEDRRAYLFGAMGAALVIGLIFLAAAGVAILLMILFWT